MNRAGLLLADCAMSLSPEERDLIRKHGSRTAIYCATEPSTTAHAEIRQFVAAGSAAAYSRFMPPKWGLQCSIGLAASSSAIMLGIEGGVHTFNHSRWASLHALDQALLDLQEEVIDYALVGAVNSSEDPLMVQRWERDFPGIHYAEGAGVMLLCRGLAASPVLENPPPAGLYFGTAHPLITYLRGANHE